MYAAGSKHVWIVLCLASIFIYLKTDAIPLLSPSKQETSHQVQNAFDATFFDFDDAFEVPSVPKTILKRSPDSDDDGNEENDGNDKESTSTTTAKPSDSNFHHGDHGHGHGHTVLKPTHSSHGGHHSHSDDDDDNRNNNSGSGGFNILEFFGTIFRLVWGFVSNIPALLFGSSSSSSSGGQ